MCPTSYDVAATSYCYVPNYIFLSAVMSIVTTSTLIRLSAIVKLLLMTVTGFSYMLCAFVTQTQLFAEFSEFSNAPYPVSARLLVVISVFIILVYVQSRQVEMTLRLDFLWATQALKEKEETIVLEKGNQLILFNILPAHVARHFLDRQFVNNMVRKVLAREAVTELKFYSEK
ncbi:unnamed protein product [Soboliphyme baturini]|uniref:PhoLip_ATPase_C domain-containing protein n=1 Tax=Soboliphyme baturini TaxID=241478 RepID=A0A183JAY3_9BILA|nr:unnamed protein product [Soboliphyme baturini]